MRPIPETPGPGHESVWDYPRPPRLEREPLPLSILFAGDTIAETREGFRVLETSHPPTYYLPADAFAPGVLVPAAGASLCEWKGRARWFDVVRGGVRAPRAAWSYPDPTPAFRAIAGHVAVYAGPMDACFVGDEKVTPQPGGFYGGWITARLAGPFKGIPGSAWW